MVFCNKKNSDNIRLLRYEKQPPFGFSALALYHLIGSIRSYFLSVRSRVARMLFAKTILQSLENILQN